MDTTRELIRGDTPGQCYKLYDDNLNPADLSGWTVWLTVKPEPDDDATDASAVLRHYIAFGADGSVTASAGFTLGGIDPDETSPTYGTYVATITDGVVTHRVPEADSTALVPGDYVYDLQVKTVGGNVRTIINNAPFTVAADVTRRTVTP